MHSRAALAAIASLAVCESLGAVGSSGPLEGDTEEMNRSGNSHYLRSLTLRNYAAAYADQVEKDYKAFQAAVGAGRFPTEASSSKIEQQSDRPKAKTQK
jgi:hypothetical protein